MKKFLFIALSVLILTGCAKEETPKNDQLYISISGDSFMLTVDVFKDGVDYHYHALHSDSTPPELTPYVNTISGVGEPGDSLHLLAEFVPSYAVTYTIKTLPSETVLFEGHHEGSDLELGYKW